MAIYFIKSEMYVKIGYSDQVFSRLTGLQTGNPAGLELIALMPGDIKTERIIQEMFNQYRHRNEWYLLTGDLIEFIEQIRMAFRSYTEQFIKSSDKLPVLQKLERDFLGRAGWIEYPKKGTRNPKRYAYWRQWLPDGLGGWIKSKPIRIKSIAPMSEFEYMKSRLYGLNLPTKLKRGLNEVEAAARGELTK